MLKKVIDREADHFKQHFGYWLLLECGHKAWHKGSRFPIRKRCWDCERYQEEKEAK